MRCRTTGVALQFLGQNLVVDEIRSSRCQNYEQNERELLEKPRQDADPDASSSLARSALVAPLTHSDPAPC